MPIQTLRARLDQSCCTGSSECDLCALHWVSEASFLWWPPFCSHLAPVWPSHPFIFMLVQATGLLSLFLHCYIKVPCCQMTDLGNVKFGFCMWGKWGVFLGKVQLQLPNDSIKSSYQTITHVPNMGYRVFCCINVLLKHKIWENMAFWYLRYLSDCGKKVHVIPH